MSRINCKAELKPKLTNHCISNVLVNKNDNANHESNNSTFTIKDTKLYILVVTLLAKLNQKLSNFF